MISPTEFVKAWQSSSSTAEVCKKLKMLCPQKEKGEDGEWYEVVDEEDQPIMVPNVQRASAMAGALRTQGVKLKKFRTKRKALTADDITELNTLCGIEADDEEIIGEDLADTTPPKKTPAKKKTPVKKKKRRQPAS